MRLQGKAVPVGGGEGSSLVPHEEYGTGPYCGDAKVQGPGGTGVRTAGFRAGGGLLRRTGRCTVRPDTGEITPRRAHRVLPASRGQTSRDGLLRRREARGVPPRRPSGAGGGRGDLRELQGGARPQGNHQREGTRGGTE